MPPYWSPIKNRWLLRVGNVTADAALNRRLSPVFHARNVRAPLLIGQGGNDVRVSQVRGIASINPHEPCATLLLKCMNPAAALLEWPAPTHLRRVHAHAGVPFSNCDVLTV
jgi:hypothetical protein